MKVYLYISVIPESLKKRKVSRAIDILKNKIHVSHGLVVMDAKNEIHENL